MNHILDLVREHGDLFYLITFVWTALEGETFVIFAGLAASHDLLDVRALFVAAALGSLFGDQVMFFLGRYYGRRIVRRFPKIQPKMEKIFSILEKYSISFILSYRFMYGVRNISALAIGMSNLSWRRFFVLNALASTLWSLVFCGGGYLFGDMMQRMGLGDEASVNFEVRGFMIAFLIIFALVIGMRVFHVRRQMQKEKEAGRDLLP
ncbi:MAG: DedA family protein [Bdellovibrionales bacterium]|jgi:membrane protein DedA with SNARE-associated domain